jgi:hypothetical protein
MLRNMVSMWGGSQPRRDVLTVLGKAVPVRIPPADGHRISNRVFDFGHGIVLGRPAEVIRGEAVVAVYLGAA